MTAISNYSLRKSLVSSQHHQRKTSQQCLDCLICHHHIDPNDQSAFVAFPCNVRAFVGETFNVWRCPGCKTIHCLDIVDLPHYYAKYPIARAELTWPFRLIYGNLCRQLTRHGFSKTHSLLDYGCGNGIFLKYLRQRGFSNCYGYDPYAPKEGLGDQTILQQGPFDYILLQDVIEHVEDPNALLSKLDALLAPGGYILIGTPNAAHINLRQPHLSDFYNEVHVPYHLHIYTRESLKSLGCYQGWDCVDFFNKPYHDTLWPGLNARAWNEYQRLLDGTLDALYKSVKLSKALTSYRFIFYAALGYWLSLRTGMAMMFRKSFSTQL